jgi:hypothetical protein
MAMKNAKTRGANTKRGGTAKPVSSSNAGSKLTVLEIKGFAFHSSARTQREWYEYEVLNATPAITELIKEQRGSYYKESTDGNPIIVHFPADGVVNGHGGITTTATIEKVVDKDGVPRVNTNVAIGALKREYAMLARLPKPTPSQKKRLEELFNEGNFIV